MKRFSFWALALAMVFTFSGVLSAQEKGHDGNWKERMMSEKIAFITMKLSLTSEEAQAFWPVYNKLSQEREKEFRKVRESYKALGDAVKGADEKAVTKALDNYTKALDASKTTDTEALAQYRKVISDEKIAKLFLAEEQFRHQQINRLQKPGERAQGPAPADGDKDRNHKPKSAGPQSEGR